MMSWSHLFSHEQCITFLWSIQKPKSILEHNPCAVLKILYLIWCSSQKWAAFQYVLKTFDRAISLPNLRFFLSTCFLSIRTGFAFLFGTDWLRASLIWARAPQLLSEKKMCWSFCQNSLTHWDAIAQINEAYDQTVAKGNTKPVITDFYTKIIYFLELVIPYINNSVSFIAMHYYL